MKFRIVASVLVLVALGAAAFVFDSEPAARPVPQQGADDSALKSLNIN